MPALDEGIKLSDEALAEMIAAVYRGEWDIDAVAESRILAETRAIFRKAVERGVPRSKAHRKAFKERLNESVDVFSTFRVHNEADEIARMLTDEEGRRRSFRDWAERVQPYLNHQNRAWLQTEYSTAIRRAHTRVSWSTKPWWSVPGTAEKAMLSPRSSKMARRRAICFSESLRISIL